MLMIGMVPAMKAIGQNWQYVGAPYIQQNNSPTTYLYFGDMEINAAGDIFVGYWQYSGILNFAKYTAGTWAQLPSPGSFPVSNIDIEVQGNNYYMAYSGVRGSNSYAWVRKYDGVSWQQLGDSVLLGNSGSGGWFDFLLDNNEVPTLMGVVSAPFADKQIMQFTGGSWTSLITLTNSNATIFRENSGLFDANNKLLCLTQGMVTTPTVQPFLLVNKIDAGLRSVVGDTIFGSAANSKIKLDATGTPYVAFTSAIISKIFAYKLAGSTWSFIADTAGASGSLLCADVTGDGKVVYNALQTGPVQKSIYYYYNNSRINMDSVNANAGVAGIQDLVTPPGSNDVYALILEVKPNIAQDFSVVKHAVTGPSGIRDNEWPAESFIVSPNPSQGLVTIKTSLANKNTTLKVFSLTGAAVYQAVLQQTVQSIDLSAQPKGLYFMQINDGAKTSTRKIILQ
jgi:hypothetical protein